MAKGGTILVVDDDVLNRIVLSTNLTERGYSVELAEDGRQALDMLAAGHYDVVLLDLLMPEMDGFQVLERMKGSTEWRNIPVIVISSLEEMESVLRCIEMGATDYLPKPFDAALLHARLNASLASKRLHDMELEYIEQVGRIARAAAEVESGNFELTGLELVAERDDSLGQLARVFQNMAHEVYAREERLKQQVERLQIKIDDAKKERQVAEITETEYFKTLRDKAERLRDRRAERE